MSPQVPPQHYWSNYDSLGRFCSYWTQIELVQRANTAPVLEIGVGNQTVSDYLRRQGQTLITLDLDPALHPDVAGDVVALPFREESFGTVMACEVLEHLPFASFEPCLRELHRVSRRFVVLSVPNAGRVWRYHIHLPGWGEVRTMLDLSWWRRRTEPQGRNEHFWELEIRGFGANRIEQAIRRSGWHILERRRPWEFPGHQFYLLGKTGATT